MNEFIRLDRANILGFAEVYRSVFNAPPWNDGWSSEAASERLQLFASFPTFQGTGLVHGSRAAGLALGWGERWVDGWTFHLKEMCLDQTLHRQGFGTSLMDALENSLRQQGFDSINLQTGRTAPAANFYAQLGFRNLDLVSLIKRL
ncbi:GNAT family N-acetyltransferase [Acidovorax kalamii]|uniref:GNAT family N-acetyltransferase n=1 Tax=Acidovorax kalamii TaxID=2004485 RepID=UPI00209156AF|nr:GNAT family N-acetyltransferase [Acidovorax kalamii]MCO5356675.1 GNAT family N-acetyltransferase [Acidovorax kalamii]